MLLLFETPAGYSLFKVSNEKKITKTEPENIHESFFSSSEDAKSTLNLVEFQPFHDTADAVSAATSCLEGKMHKSLSSFLKKEFGSKKDSLAVADKALAVSIKDKYSDWSIVHNPVTQELFRGVRCHMDELLEGTKLSTSDIKSMQLGLSHSLSRYKLKFSADKVDTMVVQAIGLLDELDKEINTYAMRVKEWYGWHFPEMQAIVADNALYAKVVMKCGFRTNMAKSDLSSILEEENIESNLKEQAITSMGTEISDMDIIHIQSLAEQVLSMTEYRAQLFEYLKNRMNAIAPNLTILVGEIVGARLIAHAGSLMNLAKFPSSTIQLLGAEKALFRALKTKHDTPKYGLIFHASLIGSAQPKHKGKIARVLAAKTALAVRVDALSDETSPEETADTTVGFEGRSKVELRLRSLQGGVAGTTGPNKDGRLTAAKTAKYTPSEAKAAVPISTYNEATDMVLDEDGSDEKKKDKKKKKKRKADDIEDDGEEEKTPKKDKRQKKEKRKSTNGEEKDGSEEEKTPKKDKKQKKEKKRKSKG